MTIITARIIPYWERGGSLGALRFFICEKYTMLYDCSSKIILANAMFVHATYFGHELQFYLQ